MKLILSIVLTVVGLNLAQAENQCIVLFKNTLISPSGLSPVFRLPHLEFVEEGNDGITYLNPTETDWKIEGSGNLSAKKGLSSVASPEATLKLAVSYANQKQKTIRIAAKDGATGGGASFSDAPNKWGHATGVRLRVSSSDPKQLHTLVIGKGANPLLMHFYAPKIPTDILMPIPEREFDTDLFQTSIFLQWQRSTKNKVDLTLYGPIVFERDISLPMTRLQEYIQTHISKSFYFNRDRYQLHQGILSQAIQNLFNPQNIEYALQVAARGVPAIQSELSVIGIHDEMVLNRKVDTSTFFVDSHAGITLFDSRIKNPMIPVEMGDFAKEHGQNSHGLQLIAMTRGMSKEQTLVFIHEIYRQFFTREVNRWAAWDMIFDAPGDSQPNSPLWWRKQLESREP